MAGNVRIRLSRSLREHWGGAESVDAEGGTLAQVLDALDARHPGLRARVVDEQGRVRRYVLVFVNRDLVAHLPPEDVRVADGDTVHILPSVAGGS